MKTIKAEELDKKFEEGESIVEYLDIEKAKNPNLETKRVNIDFPGWVISGLDKKARVLGVSRQALIKVWIAEKLKEEFVK